MIKFQIFAILSDLIVNYRIMQNESFKLYDVSLLPSNAAPWAQNISIDTNWNWNRKKLWANL